MLAERHRKDSIQARLKFYQLELDEMKKARIKKQGAMTALFRKQIELLEDKIENLEQSLYNLKLREIMERKTEKQEGR